jgi:hypothetical protein
MDRIRNDPPDKIPGGFLVNQLITYLEMLKTDLLIDM